VVEDGTGLANANTYAEKPFLTAYASDRGVTIADGDIEKFAYLAMDWLAQYDTHWIGEPATETQALAWPRKGAFFRGKPLADDAVPMRVQLIQAALVMAQAQGVVLMPDLDFSNRDAFVIAETTGPLSTQWAEGVAQVVGAPPILRTVETLLDGLLVSSGNKLRTYRV
jgi:hypothetical protein